MNILLIVALVAVIAIFIFVSLKQKKEEKDKEKVKFVPYSKRKFSDDGTEFLKHFVKFIISLAILFGWLIYWLIGVFKELKDKKGKEAVNGKKKNTKNITSAAR